MISAKPKRQGNYKAGPGRPKGSKNKKTLALEAAAREAMESVEGTFEGDAHAFLQSVYRIPEVPLEIRILAANKALRVEKPSLSAVGAKIQGAYSPPEELDVRVIELVPGVGTRAITK